MTETKKTNNEREYTIPLRDKCRPVPRYKKTPKAVKTVKEFLARHFRVENRDLKKVRLDMHLNEALWHRGIKNPIHKIKVKASMEDGIVRAYAVDLPNSIHFKKIRTEKKSTAAKAVVEAKKKATQSVLEKAKEAAKPKEAKVVEAKKAEEKEKVAAVKEVAQKEAKEEAKEVKKTTEVKNEAKDKDKEADKK